MAKHICPWWLAYSFDNPLRSVFHNPNKIFSPYVKKGMSVGDFGCGLGYFSIGLARMVGVSGKIIAVDIQPEMVKRAIRRAERKGVSDLIEFRVCDENNIEIGKRLDFSLAFWMVHETPDPGLFFKSVYNILKPSGTLLITEPSFHVSKSDFNDEVASAENAGFALIEHPSIKFSHSALLRKAPWAP